MLASEVKNAILRSNKGNEVVSYESGVQEAPIPPELVAYETELIERFKKVSSFLPTIPTLDIPETDEHNVKEVEYLLLSTSRFGYGITDFVEEIVGFGVKPDWILERIHEQTGFEIDEITGRSRVQKLVFARQIAMFLVYRHSEISYPITARIFGGRDHTTVIHAVEKVKKMVTEQGSNAYKGVVNNIEAQIKVSRIQDDGVKRQSPFVEDGHMPAFNVLVQEGLFSIPFVKLSPLESRIWKAENDLALYWNYRKRDRDILEKYLGIADNQLKRTELIVLGSLAAKPIQESDSE